MSTRNLKVKHVTDGVITEYKCEKADPFGGCIVLTNAKVMAVLNEDGDMVNVDSLNDTPEVVFLLSGAVHVYGKLGEVTTDAVR